MFCWPVNFELNDLNKITLTSFALIHYYHKNCLLDTYQRANFGILQPTVLFDLVGPGLHDNQDLLPSLTTPPPPPALEHFFSFHYNWCEQKQTNLCFYSSHAGFSIVMRGGTSHFNLC